MSALWVHVESLEAERSGIVTLSADEVRHVTARRLRAGDRLIAFDGAGRTANARVGAIGRRAVELQIEEVAFVPEPEAGLLLATAIPKGERMAVMLPMLTQLAVAVWQPLVLEDSAVRELDVESPRLRRILVESAKLARRPWLLSVRPPRSLAALLGSLDPAAGLCFGDREGETAGLPIDPAVVVIGPEAGFTAEELRMLRAAGGRSCRFGPHNMRIETAAVAAAALARSH